MIGKKRKSGFQVEQPNLKRLRKVVENLTGESTSSGDVFVVRESLRKKRRKEDRNLKKMRKNAHRRGERLPTKKSLEIKREKEVRKKLRQKKKKLERRIERERQEEERKLAEEEREREEQAKLMRETEFKMANKADDKVIKELEKKLHMRKKKGKKKIPQSFAAEGLDFLLDILGGSGNKGSDELSIDDGDDPDKLDSNDEDNDLGLGDNSDIENEGGDTEDQEHCSDGEELAEDSYEDEGEGDEESDELRLDGDDPINDLLRVNKTKDVKVKEKSSRETEATKLTEDIYGRTFDSEGQQVKTYVPPALRSNLSDDSRVKRKLQGLVNRLGGTNKLKISVEIEHVYRENSRAVVTEALTSSIISACLQNGELSEKSICDYVELLAIISSSLGFEISAMFLQSIVEKWIELCKLDEEREENKTLLNCTQVICGLYNLRVLNSYLILDLLDHICSKNQLFHIEVILVIVKQCGFTLRKDDPIGLKSALNVIKEKSVKAMEEKKGSYSRTEFMLDCLTAVRNNDVRKLPNYDAELIPLVLKDYKNILKQRSLIPVSPVNVRLQDILEAGKRGKWWLVGAAWSGDKSDKSDKGVTNDTKIKSEFSDKVLKLATRLRMNTDVRKQIFCTMFTASDVEDAVRQLLNLAKTAAYKREIINVPLDVFLRSKRNDLFVLSILKSLSNFDRKYNIILSAAVREKICQDHDKDDTYKRILFLMNDFIPADILRLNVFKELNFTQLDSRLENCIIELFKKISGLDSSKILYVFSKATDKIVNHGLQYFIRAKLACSLDEELILLMENGLRMGLKKKK